MLAMMSEGAFGGVIVLFDADAGSKISPRRFSRSSSGGGGSGGGSSSSGSGGGSVSHMLCQGTFMQSKQTESLPL
jgi:uncharacterized membrane protein